MAGGTPLEDTLDAFHPSLINEGGYNWDEPDQYVEESNQIIGELNRMAQIMTNYFWTVCSALEGNYLVFGTIFMILLLGFLLPDISRRVQVTKDIKDVKTVLDIVSKEVNRAEVACLTAADEISCMQYTVKDDTTETEKPIMSFLYTNSFDAKRPVNDKTEKSTTST